MPSDQRRLARALAACVAVLLVAAVATAIARFGGDPKLHGQVSAGPPGSVLDQGLGDPVGTALDPGAPGTTSGPATSSTSGSSGTRPKSTPKTAGPSVTLPAPVKDVVGLGVERPCGCAAGFYVLSVTARGAGGRIHLTVAGERVGEWFTDGSARTYTAVVRVPVDDAKIGAQSVAPQPNAQAKTLTFGAVAVTPTAAQFSTAGNRILDRTGRPTVYRGVNKGIYEYGNSTYTNTDEDAYAIGSWGSQMVRLPVSEALWLPQSCHYEPNYATHIDEQIQRIIKNGMIVLLDNHMSMAGDSCKDEPGNFAMADRFSIDFWKSAAARYKDNPMVWFDLYNEPHAVSDEVWRNGGTADGFQTVGMQQLYDTVRSTGTSNIVVISGTQWANDLRPALNTPVDGFGIVYAYHAYCYSCKSQADTPSYLDAWVAPVVGTYPTLLAEFSDYYKDNGVYMQRIINWAEAHHTGWLAYNWTSNTYSNFNLHTGAPKYEASANGAPVKKALMAAMGWSKPWGGK